MRGIYPTIYALILRPYMLAMAIDSRNVAHFTSKPRNSARFLHYTIRSRIADFPKRLTNVVPDLATLQCSRHVCSPIALHSTGWEAFHRGSRPLLPAGEAREPFIFLQERDQMCRVEGASSNQRRTSLWPARTGGLGCLPGNGVRGRSRPLDRRAQFPVARIR